MITTSLGMLRPAPHPEELVLADVVGSEQRTIAMSAS